MLTRRTFFAIATLAAAVGFGSASYADALPKGGKSCGTATRSVPRAVMSGAGRSAPQFVQR